MAGAEFLSVGYGGVGQAVPERAADIGLTQSRFVVRSEYTFERRPDESWDPYDESKAFWEDERIMDGVGFAFVAIPSDLGEKELEIIENLDERDVVVITAAKGATAGHFEQLESNITRGDLGISATVGGGTRLIPHLLDRLNPRTTQMHIVPNGTLNHIMHGIDQGGTPGQTIDQAVILKYAEPGATSHIDVLNGEVVGDVSKKASILFNATLRRVLGLETILTPDDINQPALTEADFEKLVAEAGERRYILSIIRDGIGRQEEDIIAPLHVPLDEGWVIVGGFRKTSINPLFKKLRLPDAWNGVVTAAGKDESDGVYPLTGPGAGPGPTAASMVQDAYHVLKARG